jgi:hypothetical protein
MNHRRKVSSNGRQQRIRPGAGLDRRRRVLHARFDAKLLQRLDFTVVHLEVERDRFAALQLFDLPHADHFVVRDRLDREAVIVARQRQQTGAIGQRDSDVNLCDEREVGE